MERMEGADEGRQGGEVIEMMYIDSEIKTENEETRRVDQGLGGRAEKRTRKGGAERGGKRKDEKKVD